MADSTSGPEEAARPGVPPPKAPGRVEVPNFKPAQPMAAAPVPPAMPPVAVPTSPIHPSGTSQHSSFFSRHGGKLVGLVVAACVLAVGGVFAMQYLKTPDQVATRMLQEFVTADSFDYSAKFDIEYGMTYANSDDTYLEGEAPLFGDPTASLEGLPVGRDELVLDSEESSVLAGISGLSEMIAPPGQVHGSMAYKGTVEMEGTIDARDPLNELIEMRIKATMEGFFMSFDIRQVGKELYVRLNDFPALGILDLGKYEGKWVYIDDKFLSEELGYDREKEGKLDAEYIRKAQELLANNKFIVMGEKLGTETVNGDKATKYSYTVDKTKAVDFMKGASLLAMELSEEQDSVKEEFDDGIEMMRSMVEFEPGAVWVGKGSQMRRVQFGMNLDSARDAKAGEPQAASWTSKFGMDLTLSNYGSPAQVTKPEGSVPIQDVMKESGIDPLGDANEKSRDARRMSDIRQLMTALEIYHLDNGAYPDQVSMYANPTASSTGPTGNTSTEWQDFLATWPEFPAAPEGPCAAYPYNIYVYKGVASEGGASDTSDPSSYELSYCFEGAGGYGEGVQKARPNGTR